uniref:Elongin-C n=1 Tax=Neobodo designis TaxID=312471 RepID=A0A7S1LP44_NEODS|mmetsp:Transcript_25843/g.79765  ORF Transcript_25843/g.79765 Transcript_25843/m.79765 type:complete len:131 (+) Transcript_25843:44-436(+)|eukprot:CAMPEP_0174853678 /NCGR_PEP_ID=MMETSP1114-20130205/29446_1 /TAXON_ID=312471 /ORGANISM="Neobodo designis, Strain CCAP 1951/1" /LENGTH=130 /DNA_ID=CAMNT_0016088339 /DNA_START=44 /DNA_END=436 /DNA_ORIENTATION=+
MSDSAAVAAPDPAGELAPSPAAPQNVVLISGEGHRFTISREAADQSRTLRDFLKGTSHMVSEDAAASAPEIPLENIATNVLELVCQFLNERLTSNNDMNEFKALQSMDPTNEGDRQLVLELLLAADYLDC